MLFLFVFTLTPFERVKLDPPACTTKLCHARQLTGTDLAHSCETSDLRQKSSTVDSSWVNGGEECIGSDVRKPYDALKWPVIVPPFWDQWGETEETEERRVYYISQADLAFSVTVWKEAQRKTWRAMWMWDLVL